MKSTKTIEAYSDLLTVVEAAELIRVHKSTIYKLIKEGQIQAYKLGREYKIPKLFITENFFR
jgi:excisionase family DNA binding protein